MKQDVLLSGKSSFKIEVPYKLLETGSGGPKPLILYLHGFGHNLERFREDVADMMQIKAFHLFIQGPYPIYERDRNRKVEDWGRAWYLYDGEQSQFAKSLEVSSEFIQEIVDKLLLHIEASRLCVLGYSMGAYLAGYFALSRWKHVNELVMIGGRLKTELFEDREHNYDHLHILGLHGSDDRTVEAEPQKKSIATVSNWGAKATFTPIDEGHNLSSAYLLEAIKWLVKRGYKRF
ncbi:MAG: hypothetical protein R3281_14840 [Balneolaceae bacterium]|nr:hypothetical protein [Balneolaceae bacterium]